MTPPSRSRAPSRPALRPPGRRRRARGDPRARPARPHVAGRRPHRRARGGGAAALDAGARRGLARPGGGDGAHVGRGRRARGGRRAPPRVGPGGRARARPRRARAGRPPRAGAARGRLAGRDAAARAPARRWASWSSTTAASLRAVARPRGARGARQAGRHRPRERAARTPSCARRRPASSCCTASPRPSTSGSDLAAIVPAFAAGAAGRCSRSTAWPAASSTRPATTSRW